MNKINKTFSDYFHPKKLWKEGNLGKAKAIGAVISWGTLVLPVIMGIGLAISKARHPTKINKNPKVPIGAQSPTSQKVETVFASVEAHTSQKVEPFIERAPLKQVSEKLPIPKKDLLSIVKPGKEITKIEPFDQWLENEYSNKASATYQAYQALQLNHAKLVGIRGDGNCGFRAMIVSLLLQLATSPQCQSKFNLFCGNLDKTIKENQNAIPGFEKLNKKCLQDLKNCNGEPEKLLNLLNQNDFINDLTRILRFLSNACCLNQMDQLPEEVRIQLQFGDGAMELGGVEPFLNRHATVDVDNENVQGYLFAGIAQILVLSEALGLGYIINKINEGNPNPEEPNMHVPNNALVVLNMICRDTRHFDVIFNTNQKSDV